MYKNSLKLTHLINKNKTGMNKIYCIDDFRKTINGKSVRRDKNEETIKMLFTIVIILIDVILTSGFHFPRLDCNNDVSIIKCFPSFLLRQLYIWNCITIIFSSMLFVSIF